MGITNDKNATESNFTQFARKAYANVNYEIVSPAPKFVSTIKSLLSASDFKVNCQSLSPTSTFEKQKKKWRMYYEEKVLNPMREQVGIPKITLPWVPQDETELEMYEKYHGFKLPLESGMEDIAAHTFNISDWDKIRLRTIEKLVETNFAVGQVYADKDGVTRMRFINPASFVTAYLDEDEEGEGRLE